MESTRSRRGVAAADRQAFRVHHARFSSQQRLHRAAILIAFAFACPLGAQDFDFDLGITHAEFHELSAIVTQAVFTSPKSCKENKAIKDLTNENTDVECGMKGGADTDVSALRP